MLDSRFSVQRTTVVHFEKGWSAIITLGLDTVIVCTGIAGFKLFKGIIRLSSVL